MVVSNITPKHGVSARKTAAISARTAMAVICGNWGLFRLLLCGVQFSVLVVVVHSVLAGTGVGAS